MKNLIRIGIFTLILFLSINNLKSQSLEFVYPPITVINGDPNEEIKSEAQVRNIASSTINIKVKMTMVQLYSGHMAYFCLGNCFAPQTQDFVMPGSIALEPGEITIGLKYYDLVLIPDGIEGQSIIKMTFFVEGNPTDSVEYTVTFNSTTPVLETENETFLFAEPVPNPAGDYITFRCEIPEGLANGIIEIYSNQGLLITKQKLNGQKLENYNTALLPSGTYYAVIKISDKKKAVRKFVVSH